VKLFDVEDIELIHMQIIDMSGGSYGTRDRGRLESGVAAQTQSVFGKDVYLTLFDKAAALARGIIGDHPFSDGNKRTGMMLAIIFLERNDVKTNIENSDLEDFAVRIATDQLDVPAIATWLEANTDTK
jgi:death on curing protein